MSALRRSSLAALAAYAIAVLAITGIGALAGWLLVAVSGSGYRSGVDNIVGASFGAAVGAWYAFLLSSLGGIPVAAAVTAISVALSRVLRRASEVAQSVVHAVIGLALGAAAVAGVLPLLGLGTIFGGATEALGPILLGAIGAGILATGAAAGLGWDLTRRATRSAALADLGDSALEPAQSSGVDSSARGATSS